MKGIEENTFLRKLKISVLCFLLVIGPVVIPQTLSSPPLDPSVIAPIEQLSKAFAAIAARVKPAVVSVFSEKMIRFRPDEMPFPFGDDLLREFFGRQAPGPQSPGHPREYKIPQLGMGSGMVLDHHGHILTNYHVVQNVDDIKVLFQTIKPLKPKLLEKISIQMSPSFKSKTPLWKTTLS
ncbi:MAG TPA: hypothetical protein VIG33_15195 [Pseudobdellovibrionaceae bacterium]|jgi:serine protease Do